MNTMETEKKILYIHKTKKYVHLFNNHEYN